MLGARPGAPVALDRQLRWPQEKGSLMGGATDGCRELFFGVKLRERVKNII